MAVPPVLYRPDSGLLDFVQRLLYLIQLEWLDDRFDLFHGSG
jgi:hypothetical protein